MTRTWKGAAKCMDQKLLDLHVLSLKLCSGFVDSSEILSMA